MRNSRLQGFSGLLVVNYTQTTADRL